MMVMLVVMVVVVAVTAVVMVYVTYDNDLLFIYNALFFSVNSWLLWQKL